MSKSDTKEPRCRQTVKQNVGIMRFLLAGSVPFWAFVSDLDIAGRSAPEEGRVAPQRRASSAARDSTEGWDAPASHPSVSAQSRIVPAHRVFSSSRGEPAAAGIRRQLRHPQGPGPAARWSPSETACSQSSPPASVRRSARWRHRSAAPWCRQSADQSHRAPCPASTLPPRSGSVPGSRSTTPSPTALPRRSPSGSPPTAPDSSHPAWGPSSAVLPASPTARRSAAHPAPAWAAQKAPPSGPASAQQPEQTRSPVRAQRSVQCSARVRSSVPGPAWAPATGRCSDRAQHSAQARRTVPGPAWAQRSAPGPASPSVPPRVPPSATVPGSAPPASGRTARRASSS